MKLKNRQELILICRHKLILILLLIFFPSLLNGLNVKTEIVDKYVKEGERVTINLYVREIESGDKLRVFFKFHKNKDQEAVKFLSSNELLKENNQIENCKQYNQVFIYFEGNVNCCDKFCKIILTCIAVKDLTKDNPDYSVGNISFSKEKAIGDDEIQGYFQSDDVLRMIVLSSNENRFKEDSDLFEKVLDAKRKYEDSGDEKNLKNIQDSEWKAFKYTFNSPLANRILAKERTSDTEVQFVGFNDYNYCRMSSPILSCEDDPRLPENYSEVIQNSDYWKFIRTGMKGEVLSTNKMNKLKAIADFESLLWVRNNQTNDSKMIHPTNKEYEGRNIPVKGDKLRIDNCKRILKEYPKMIESRSYADARFTKISKGTKEYQSKVSSNQKILNTFGLHQWIDDGDGIAEKGEQIRYYYEIKNTSDYTILTDITLEDELLNKKEGEQYKEPVFKYKFVDLDPQEYHNTRAINPIDKAAYYTLQAEDIEKGSVSNTAKLYAFAKLPGNNGEKKGFPPDNKKFIKDDEIVNLHGDCECFKLEFKYHLLNEPFKNDIQKVKDAVENTKNGNLFAALKYVKNKLDEMTEGTKLLMIGRSKENTIKYLKSIGTFYGPIYSHPKNEDEAKSGFEDSKIDIQKIPLPKLNILMARAIKIDGFHGSGANNCCAKFGVKVEDDPKAFVQIRYHLPLFGKKPDKEANFPNYQNGIRGIPFPSVDHIPGDREKQLEISQSLSWTPDNFEPAVISLNFGLPFVGGPKKAAWVYFQRAIEEYPDFGFNNFLTNGYGKIELWVNNQRCKGQTIYLNLGDFPPKKTESND